MSENTPKQITTYNSNIKMSENTPKEITRYNSNIKMSKNNSKNKNINYNIVYSNMTSKTVKLNIEILEGLAKKVKNADLKEKADNLVQLYKDRKLTQKTTAENQIRDFIKYNSFKPRKQKTINNKYNTLVDKYADVKPLGERMKDNKYIESIEIKNEDSAKTEVVFNIKKLGMDFDGLRVFLSVHNTIYKQLYEKCLKIVKQKKSVKVQTICEYQWKSGTKDKDKLEMNTALLATGGIRTDYASSKVIEASETTLDGVLDSQKYEVDEKMDRQQDSNSISRINKIIVAIYTIKKARGSSFIATPEKYSNAKCGLINIKNYDNECFKWCM